MSREIFRKELALSKPYVPGKPIEEVKRGRRVYDLLEEITGETFGEDPEAWVSWWEAQQ